ncbi:MAG TPA: chemotaxis protein CheW [Isosphaeraceae bacterium]|nr:chemotaxis protein CheW [Isosphaeraceae bacterium]
MFLLTFRAAQNLYAVDVARVVEVVPRVELRGLPYAPAFFAGLFDYRGTVTPVVDLGLLLGSEACPDRLSTRIIVANCAPANCGPREPLALPGRAVTEEETIAGSQLVEPLRDRRRIIGLIAEQVSEVVSIEPGQVISPPIQLPQAPYLGAIVTIDQAMVQLIAPDKLLPASLWQSFLSVALDDSVKAGPPGHSEVGSA